jgi:glutaredoxin
MQVVMYTKPDCQYCTKARNLLNMLAIPYTQVEVGVGISSEDYTANFWPTVPCVVVDGEIIGGYTELGNWSVNKYFG